MEIEQGIVIIGGGLAGLTCALHLLKEGFEVTLIEKSAYPQHKVCGEYISNEVLPYLKWLDADPLELNPTSITKLMFSAKDGKTINCILPLGGFGLSRFSMDHFLYEKAIEKGCKFIIDTVNTISFATKNNLDTNGSFVISTMANGVLNASIVIGAYGKRSAIDQKLSRKFIFKKSPWLAVKAHYYGSFPEDLVGLHNFKGGYCGVSKVENNLINICYLTDYASFKAYGNIADFEHLVVCRNPHLKTIFENCTMAFEQPLTISQISFEEKEPVCNHILMIGDTAGLIHPLCGNGMAMAIHSAKICAEVITAHLTDKSIKKTRIKLEDTYVKKWNKQFKGRLKTGRLLSLIIRKESLLKPLLNLLVKFPSVLPLIVKKTHGKPIS